MATVRVAGRIGGWIAALALCGCGDEPASGPAAPAGPSPAPTLATLDRDESYHPILSVPAPSGDRVTVALRVEDGQQFHFKGSYSFRQTASGRFQPTIFGTKRPAVMPPEVRSFSGALDLVRRVSLGGGALLSRVEGTIAIERSEGAGAPSVGLHRVGILFAEDGHGAAVHRTIHVETGSATGGDSSRPIQSDDLEALWNAFTARFRPPERPVRVGDRFALRDAIFLDDVMSRPTWMIFQRTQEALPLPTGAVWVHAIEGRGPDATLVVRAAVRHEHAGPTDPPPAPRDTVNVEYEGAIEATRRIAIDGGHVTSHELALRRRYRFRSLAFDYTVANEKHLRLDLEK